MTSTYSMSQMSHSSSVYKHTSGTSHNGKENFSSTQSKFTNDLANINNSFSSVSLESKLKNLNVPHVEPKVAASKK